MVAHFVLLEKKFLGFKVVQIKKKMIIEIETIKLYMEVENW